MKLPNGVPMLCCIRRGDTAGLKRCVKCEYIPEEVYVYERCTTYCGWCFHALTDGGSRTMKTPQMQEELDIKCTLNLGLPKLTLDCPICPEAAQYKDIMKHIAEMHPGLLGQEAQPSPRKNQVQEAVNGATLSRGDAKKYIENILRLKKQLGDNTSRSVEDREKHIAELQARQKERKSREPPMPEVENKTPVAAASANPKELPHIEEWTVAKPPRHDTTSHELCRKHIELLQDEIRLLKEERGNLQTSVQDLQTTAQSLQTTVENLQATVQKLLSSEEKNVKSMAKLEDEQKSASTHRLKLEELIQKQESNSQESETCVQKLRVELRMDRLLPVFEHIWKLQPYSALRKSLLFNNTTLSTGVLSVNTPGYKIELMISIRGDYREWRRQLLKDESNCTVPAPQLDAMFRIHQGEDDDLLAWPFKNKISLLLLNHLDEDKSKLLELGSGDADGDWLKKPKREALNPMFGFSGVISLTDLENVEAGFLFHDCIVFKLTVHRRE